MESFFIYLCKASSILIIFYLVYQSLLKKETLFIANRYFLIVGLVGSIFLPFIHFTQVKHLDNIDIHHQEMLVAPVVSSNSYFELSIGSMLFFIYILGVVVLSIRFCLQLISLSKIFQSKTYKKTTNYTLIQVKENITPFSFFKYIVYNPDVHSSEELQQILSHEKVHVLQYHTIDMLLINSMVIFQWINPFMWFYKKNLVQNLEFIADQIATDKIPSKKAYQQTLLKISLRTQYTLTNNFYQSLIKKRIVMLNKQKSNPNKTWNMLWTLPLVILFLVSFNTKEVVVIEASEPQHPSLIKRRFTSSQVIQFVVNKNTSKEDIEKITRILQNEYNVKAIFKEVKRNSQNEISAINLEISSQKDNLNYELSDETAITSFIIKYDYQKDIISIHKLEEGKRIFISTAKDTSQKRRTEIVEIYPDQNENHEFIFIDELDKENHILLHDNDSDEKSFRFITGGKNKDPLIYIDGKKVSRREMKKLSSNKIASINVLKGEKAIKKYGKNAKNGVIEIKTKEKS